MRRSHNEHDRRGKRRQPSALREHASLRRIARPVVTVIIGLAILFVAAFVPLSLAYSPTYMIRLMLWQEADVQDYTRFPAREIAAAQEPFTFAHIADPVGAADRVRQAMAASPNVGRDPDTFLAEAQTQAFVVVQEDRILYERYFNGFERGSVATSFSIAKSYVSALVGIAIREGSIRSADEPITTYLPELLQRDKRFGAITVQDLLDMTSGIHYDDSGFIAGDDSQTYYFDDLRALALERTRVDQPPDQRWQYNNYNPLLLGLILERTTGMHVAEYLELKLWTRIGTEFRASWSLDSDDGFEKMESGINARPIDFAKLGRLYLNQGSWNGAQVVPADWAKRSVQAGDKRSAGYYPSSLQKPYGTISHEMFWWRIARPNGEVAFSAFGNHGQYIFVAPSERLIIVRFGMEYGIPAFDWFEVFSTIADGLRNLEN